VGVGRSAALVGSVSDAVVRVALMPSGRSCYARKCEVRLQGNGPCARRAIRARIARGAGQPGWPAVPGVVGQGTASIAKGR